MQPTTWILEKELKMEDLRAAAEKEWQSIIQDFPRWSATDARRWALSRFPTMFFMPVLGLCLRRTVLEDPRWWEAYSPGAGHLLFDRGRDEFDRHLKSKLLLDLAHNVEHPFRVILKALDPSNRATDFSAIYRDLLRANNPYLKNVPPRWQEVLDLIRLSRNTVHNSWVHSPANQKNYSVTFKGVSYAFVVGNQLEFMSWDFLHDLAEEALRIMVAVVRDENVIALSAIPDLGAGDPISP